VISKNVALLGILLMVAVGTIPNGAYAMNNLVKVSFYGDGGRNECGKGRSCHGSKMANGKTFNKNDPTIIAHKKLPFGTLVELCREDKCLVAEVQDRGPYVKDREFDLSLAGAKRLGFVDEGVARVKVRILKKKEVDLVDSGNPSHASDKVAVDEEELSKLVHDLF
jgi:rare lipoprotein A